MMAFILKYAWIVLPFIYCGIALNLGKARGFLRHVQAVANNYKQDQHPNHAWLHILIWALCVLILGNLFQPAFLLCTFSFWHDGMMYLTRDKLSPGVYPKRFFDFTKTPKSFSDKIFGNTGSRVLLALFGMICYIGFQLHYVLNIL